MPTNPKPNDIIQDNGKLYVCCTAKHLRDAYDLPANLMSGDIFAYRPDPENPRGVSWNSWTSGHEFNRIVVAPGNRTYKHGDGADGHTLLSARVLRQQLSDKPNTALVYLDGAMVKPYLFADPKPGDTIETAARGLFTCISLTDLQKTYGLALVRTTKRTDAYGITPSKGRICVDWMEWNLTATQDSDFGLKCVYPAQMNQPPATHGAVVMVQGVTRTLLSWGKLYDLVSPSTGFVTIEGATMIARPEYKEAE